MITIYAGLIKENEDGKYVENFYPLNLQHAKSMEYEHFSGEPYVSAVKIGSRENYSDSTKIWDLLNNLFEYNIGAHKYEQISFFTSEDINSEMNFKMAFMGNDTARYNYITIFDPKRKIYKSMRVNESTIIVFNNMYQGGSIEEILENMKEVSAETFLNEEDKTLASMCFTNNALFDAYGYDDRSGAYKAWFNNVNECFSMNHNLESWQNWHTLITGRQPYEGFTMKLDEPVNGVEEIEFSLPIAPDNTFDTANDIQNGKVFQYMMVGTDLTTLFTHPYDRDSEEVVLNDGFILRKTVVGTNTRIEIIKSYSSTNVGYRTSNFIFDKDPFNFGTTYFENLHYTNALYWVVNPEFIPRDVDKWKDSISELETTLDYNTDPFYFITHTTYNSDTNIISNYSTRSRSPKYLANITDIVWFALYDQNYELNNLPKREYWIPLIEGIQKNKHWDGKEPNIGSGYISHTGGGNGNYDERSDTITHFIPGDESQLTNRFIGTYEIEDRELEQLSRWLAGSGSFGDNLQYAGGIISVKKMFLPEAPTLGPETILSIYGKKVNPLPWPPGSRGNAYGWPVTKNLYGTTFGTFRIDEFFGNFLDYTQTKISMYLPFAGLIPLDATEVMNSTLTLYLNYDIVSGTGIWSIRTDKDGKEKEIFSKECKLSMEIPVTAESSSRLATTVMNGIATTATSAAIAYLKGGVPAAIAGAAISATTYTFNHRNEPSHEGILASNFGDVTGFLSNRIPFLVITRPKMSIPETYGQHNGYPSNISARLGDLKGYTKVKDVHMEGFGKCTRSEIDAIESILKEGFII